MGSSSNKNTSNVISVGVDELKEQLNALYSTRKNKPRNLADPALFDRLWDLKELAILEGRTSVELPKTWLDELNDAMVQMPSSNVRSH
ncbi:MAG TPA: hypothetical protein V6D17_17495 [Candidatus Obscuribacterales bacterium]